MTELAFREAVNRQSDTAKKRRPGRRIAGTPERVSRSHAPARFGRRAATGTPASAGHGTLTESSDRGAPDRSPRLALRRSIRGIEVRRYGRRNLSRIRIAPIRSQRKRLRVRGPRYSRGLDPAPPAGRTPSGVGRSEAAVAREGGSRTRARGGAAVPLDGSATHAIRAPRATPPRPYLRRRRESRQRARSPIPRSRCGGRSGRARPRSPRASRPAEAGPKPPTEPRRIPRPRPRPWRV